MDVKAVRAGSDIAVSGVDVARLRTRIKGTTVHIYGDDFPADLTEADIDLGSGVKVAKVVSRTPNEVTATVERGFGGNLLAAGSVAVRRAVATSSYTSLRSHLILFEGGARMVDGPPRYGRASKGYFQFEAIAFANGPRWRAEHR